MKPPRLPTDSLAFALLGAAHAIEAVESGTALPQALNKIFMQWKTSPQSRGAIQDLAYTGMRDLAHAGALLDRMTGRPIEPPTLRALLGCALSLLKTAEHDARYTTFTVVDQAVTAAAADRQIAHAKGMVNAVLRRYLRERNTLEKAIADLPEAHWNYPMWWIEAAQHAYPNHWEGILKAGNQPPPLTLRINRRRTCVEDYMERLSEQGIAADIIGPSAIRLAQATPVSQIPGFNEGLVSVQDAAAQLAAPLLDVKEGMRVLDACAAPGGKTGHLLELTDIDMLALDHDPQRLTRIEENLQRLQLRATLCTGDAASKDWWDGRRFDRILADVPCTASGIVRRHPDIRWLRRETDTTQLAAVSETILDNLWQMLEPNGKLLFVTCSLWPQESEEQASAFAARHRATRLPAPGQLMPTAEAKNDHDGLFYALFEKPTA